METVPFVFSLAVVDALHVEVSSFGIWSMDRNSPHRNLIRLSSPIWSQAALSLYEDVNGDKMRYRVMNNVTIYRGKERGMCFCEIEECNRPFRTKLSLKDVKSTRFLRSSSVSFTDTQLHGDKFEQISLEDAFIKLVIPFASGLLEFDIQKDKIFFLDVLSKLQEHELVLTRVSLGSLSIEMYDKVEKEMNKFVTFQIKQGCLRDLGVPYLRDFSLSIPKEELSAIFYQPQFESTNFEATFPTKAFEAFAERWSKWPTSLYRPNLSFEDDLNHKDLQRMGFKEITRWKKLRRLLKAVGLGSHISSYRSYKIISQKYRLYVTFSSVTRLGYIHAPYP
uniref:FTH domain-containing protein n=1 Tax=Steinernema glaseri TaxID=37863 RepID=A0A1I8AHB3_9BILA